jgi:transposase
MAKVLVSDELWELVEPLLPPIMTSPKGGRPPIGNREALTGILFVLRTGIPWSMLPQEMGCGCGMSCWRRLRDWQQAGVWNQLHELLLEKLHAADRIDWSRAIVDSSSVRALLGGQKPAETPRIAARRGASTMSSRMRRAFHWPLRSRVPTPTM